MGNPEEMTAERATELSENAEAKRLEERFGVYVYRSGTGWIVEEEYGIETYFDSLIEASLHIHDMGEKV